MTTTPVTTPTWRRISGNGYLSVGQMYLYDNPLLKQPLKLAQMSVGTRTDRRESCVHDLPVE